MAIKPFAEKVISYLKKYRYAVLIVLLGIVLMALPPGKDDVDAPEPIAIVKEEITLEQRLEDILSRVEGAGEVKVILTVSAGEETRYQVNETHSQGKEDVHDQTDTVKVTDASRNETGLVKQVVPAIYKGAVVVCQGAGNPSVRYSIVDAVSKLTGIGANCISVLKMK